MNKMAVIFTDTKKNNPRLEAIFYSSRELGEILSKNSLGTYNEAIVCHVLSNPLLSYEVRDSESAETLSLSELNTDTLH